MTQTFGYTRDSTLDQNAIRQLDGEHLDRVFTDKASGKDQNRPELAKLIDYARDGDTVLVHSMDRLARNLDDLRAIVRQLTDKKVQVRFVKENLTFTGDDTAMATFLLSIMGAFAEFERALIRERQREGIALAKKADVYKGRSKALSGEQASEIARRAAAGEAKATLAREHTIGRVPTLSSLPTLCGTVEGSFSGSAADTVYGIRDLQQSEDTQVFYAPKDVPFIDVPLRFPDRGGKPSRSPGAGLESSATIP